MFRFELPIIAAVIFLEKQMNVLKTWEAKERERLSSYHRSQINDVYKVFEILKWFACHPRLKSDKDKSDKDNVETLNQV